MERDVLTDAQWDKIAPLLPGRVGSVGVSAKDNRLFLEGVLWIARTGAPWRDLPAVFGFWGCVYVRYNRWCKSGIWTRLFEALADEPDFEYVMIDSTIVRAHQHSAGGKGGLRIRPLDALGVATRRKSTSLSTPLAIPSSSH
jgi:putative transposase